MFIGIIKQTIMITSFVLAMMLIIEYINVQTRGRWIQPFKRKGWLQILSAALLGLIPGCLGTYTAVSLYAHKIFGFAGLVTAMIATSGDEAFFMLSVIPQNALLLFAIIFGVAILSGSLIYAFMRNRTLMNLPENHLQVHEEHENCVCFAPKEIGKQLKNISFQRAIIIAGLILFIFGLLIGEFGHAHEFDKLLHPHEHHHDHVHEGSIWNWISISFLIVSLLSLFIIITVNDHFLEAHLWNHIIKKHFLKIFLWTLAALTVLHFINEYIDVREWARANFYIMLLIAVLVGIIPQSGPHFIFVLMFAEGSIPFSILLANSIVQDGHGSIPLLAESGKSFILVKLVNILIGLLFGIFIHLLGW
ncbi:MAG: putative manganese transporter [Bacteroidales bacterium]|nr:putative manganese transporter [Bacteroidales bacterium]MCF8387708.1 putative manganese transporter [Bacteroidales bacterium]MCF8398508.1 putative manganese transporter [Bacteroidales bacterium]